MTDPGGPQLDLGGYEGPMDLLLELAQRQRVDLGSLSILLLAEQFVAAVEAAGMRVPLERQGDWLVTASALVLLRSRLLLPAGPAAVEAGQQAAAHLRQLDELARMRAAAAWLTDRPQLGQEVFARGVADRRARPRSELLLTFLEAVLAMLEGRPGKPGDALSQLYRPEMLQLWRVPDAMARLRLLLAEGGGPLSRFLPPIPPGAGQRLRGRAALASTFVGALELAREEGLDLRQASPFGTILLQPASNAFQDVAP